MDISQKIVAREITESINKKTMPGRAKLDDLIDYFNLESTKQDVKDWQSARLNALDVHIPDWTDLIRVYDDVIVDSHLTGIVEIVKDKIKATEFEIVNDKGEVDDEKTGYFEKKWFFKFLDWAIEAIYYPVSLIQLGNMVDNGFPDIELIKREYVTPNREFVKKSLEIYGTYKHGVDGWVYTNPSISQYFIPVYPPTVLGMFDRVASHALGKKHMLIYLWRYGELFGLPIRIGKTDTKDPARRVNMENMMSNMGNAMWGVIDPDDSVELKEAKSNSSEPYLAAMNYSNKEMSKALMGTSSVMDETSFVGAAEIGERIYETKGKGYLRDLRFLINDELIPRMIKYMIPIAGCSFRWVNEDKVSYDQKIEAVKTLAPYFKLDKDEVGEKMGFALDEKENTQEDIIKAVQAKSKSIVAEASKMYSI